MILVDTAYLSCGPINDTSSDVDALARYLKKGR